MNTVETLICVFLCIGVGYYSGSSDIDKELENLKIEKTKLNIEILKLKSKDRGLTVADLSVIYKCVDTKIKNNGKDNKQ